ncbi:hypothetical protein BXP70_24460 [Hymenobacter crusticola]|uniref:Uncharacterized protein n=1 Tax=Hymenobacter crusticola TaxID=1770526 RepID=A0A243W738_9BACT|nr:hypothetical protein BXP70_24460 [Hymenobacter crusticola]
MKPLNHKFTPQPFYVVVTKNKVELARFEPMKQELVKRRLHQLRLFTSPKFTFREKCTRHMAFYPFF